jgi:hypothetical protein
MMTRIVVALTALLMAVGGACAPAWSAEPCTVDGGDRNAAGFADAVTTAIKTAWSCGGAYRILETCPLGSSTDKALSDLVLAKCEPMFAPKASPAVKTAYDKARDKCNQSVAKKPGPTNDSQVAVCLARAGRDFARKYGVKG